MRRKRNVWNVSAVQQRYVWNVYEHELSGFLCDHHAQDHPHDNYGDPMPLVNSPRVGMCGYEGPAEPPY